MSFIVTDQQVTDQQTEAEWNKFVELMREISEIVSPSELQSLIDEIAAVSMEYSHQRKLTA